MLHAFPRKHILRTSTATSTYRTKFYKQYRDPMSTFRAVIISSFWVQLSQSPSRKNVSQLSTDTQVHYFTCYAPQLHNVCAAPMFLTKQRCSIKNRPDPGVPIPYGFRILKSAHEADVFSKCDGRVSSQGAPDKALYCQYWLLVGDNIGTMLIVTTRYPMTHTLRLVPIFGALSLRCSNSALTHTHTHTHTHKLSPKAEFLEIGSSPVSTTHP